MIPKTIHYCWVGDAKKPELVQRCITSWQTVMPDYQIKEWNDDSLAALDNAYLRQAYQAKAWAFVSDYVRLHAVYTMGGIYMDTDVEVFKRFDDLLGLEFFTGYQVWRPNGNTTTSPISACFGAEQNNTIVGDLLRDYDHRSFLRANGKYDTTTNTVLISRYFDLHYGLRYPYDATRSVEIYPGAMIFRSGFFDHRRGPDSYAVHHGTGTWFDFHNRQGKSRSRRRLEQVYASMPMWVVLGYHACRRLMWRTQEAALAIRRRF